MYQILIRKMEQADIEFFPAAFKAQGWEKPQSQFERYYKRQQNKEIQVFVAEASGAPAGYVLLLPYDPHGPFSLRRIPAISDFNVLKKYQRNGIGSRLLDAAEAAAAEISDEVCLGVGLHSGYGPAQRLYIKRGYLPDGSGVWFQDKPLSPYTACVNDDNLVLYLSKKLKLK